LNGKKDQRFGRRGGHQLQSGFITGDLVKYKAHQDIHAGDSAKGRLIEAVEQKPETRESSETGCHRDYLDPLQGRKKISITGKPLTS